LSEEKLPAGLLLNDVEGDADTPEKRIGLKSGSAPNHGKQE
jgi:hypothetical protein